MSTIRLIDNDIPLDLPPIGKRYMWIDTFGRINTMNYLGTITTMGDSNANYIKMKRELGVLNINATDINTALGVLDVTEAKTINITMNANITNLILTGLNSMLDESNNPINADGLKTIINFIQTPVGGKTVAFSPTVIYSTAFGVTPLHGGANTIDVAEFMYSHALSKHKFTSFLHGFNI